MAVLSLLLGEEVGLFIAPILVVVGLPFLVAAMNCRVTMNMEQVTVRNFFRVSKRYSFKEIESWRMNTHYIYLYPVNGRRICIRREDDVEGRLENLVARVQITARLNAMVLAILSFIGAIAQDRSNGRWLFLLFRRLPCFLRLVWPV